MGDCRKLTAVLVDTVSIQDYIFSSNKLLENIGASRLVDEIYEDDEFLKKALEETCARSPVDLDAWHNDPDALVFSPCGIGYIGGGNALVLFESDNDRHLEFIRNFTRVLLEKAPGLRTAFGICRGFDLDNFKDSMEAVHQSLRRNKNRFFPVLTLPKHGITAECPLSGEALEPLVCKGHDGRLISRVSRSKIDRGPAALEKIRKMTSSALKGCYTFTNEIEKLGQVEHRDYIAVVHVDGNKMGDRFQECGDLPALRRLSSAVSERTKGAFRQMIAELVSHIDKGDLGKDDGFNFSQDGGLTILPVRPVVIGGDDITFVCDGRLGTWLAERFVDHFSQGEGDFNGSPLTACAGVCVVKTRYPFYRAYEIAEQLCAAAKKKSRQAPGSYLDFLISSGGFSGTLEDVRARLGHSPGGRLNFGPYRLGSTGGAAGEDDIAHLKEGMKHFDPASGNNWSRTALARLREVIATEEDPAGYRAEMVARKRSLYEIPGCQYHENIRFNGRTPYYDMIELIDFYPPRLR